MGIIERLSSRIRGEKTSFQAILPEPLLPPKKQSLLALPETIKPYDRSADYLHGYAYDEVNGNHSLGEVARELFRNQGVIPPEQAAQLSDPPYIPGVINKMTDGSIMSPPIIQGYVEERERTGEVIIGNTKLIVLDELEPFRVPRIMR